MYVYTIAGFSFTVKYITITYIYILLLFIIIIVIIYYYLFFLLYIYIIDDIMMGQEVAFKHSDTLVDVVG